MIKCDICGDRSSVGVHGLVNGEVTSDHYCDRCYNLLKKGRDPQKEIQND